MSADRIAALESQLAQTTALLNAGAERIAQLEAALEPITNAYQYALQCNDFGEDARELIGAARAALAPKEPKP